MSEIIVTTATTLESQEKNKILSSLEKRFGKKSKIIFNSDPEIISGIKIMFGSKMLDLSAKNKLEIIRETLKNNL